ncbi:MAG TPA: MarR family transcriptional regulator [Steroidobacteraceae bacterium]|jgi:DNA-binding MarR family transcriptional regulator
MYQRPVGTIYLVKRMELAVRSCMEVGLAQFDLTPAQMLMMFRLRDQPDISSAALSRDIGVRPQSIIGLIHPLESRGLLERQPSPRHQRVLHLRLTAAGKKLMASAMRVAARIEGELLVDLDDRQVAALQDALTKVWQRAEAHDLHPGSIRAKAEQMFRDQLASGQRKRSRPAKEVSPSR